MDIILKLILAHFIADYPLQWGGLVSFKQKSVWGILAHTYIHLFVMLFLLWPYLHLDSAVRAILFIFILHNVADFTKIHIDRTHKKGRLARYLLDQLFHFAIVLIAYWAWLRGATPLISDAWKPCYLGSSWVLFLIALILSTYFWDVTRWTYRNSKKPQPYIRDWNIMRRNALIVTAGFAAYWLL